MIFLFLLGFASVACKSQTFNTTIGESRKTEIKATKVDVEIKKQINYFADSTKGMSDKPEIDFWVGNANPNPSIRRIEDTIIIKVILRTIDRPIAKNLVDYTAMMHKSNGAFVINDEHFNNVFNESDQLNETKTAEITYTRTLLRKNFKIDDTLFMYFRLAYTDRNNKRSDTLRQIFYYTVVGENMFIKMAKQQLFKAVKLSLQEKKRW